LPDNYLLLQTVFACRVMPDKVEPLDTEPESVYFDLPEAASGNSRVSFCRIEGNFDRMQRGGVDLPRKSKVFKS